MNYIKVLLDLWKLKQDEKKTVDEIAELQKRKLDKLLRYAYEHSEYYRKSFENAGITAENLNSKPLSSFPSIDKSILLTQFDKLVTVSNLKQEEIRRFDEHEKLDRKPFKGKYHIVHSSGSTGKPGFFVYDRTAWNSMLLGIIRGALWNMSMPQILKFLISKPRVVYIAATDGRYGGAMAVGDGIDGVGAEQIYLDVKTPLDKWVIKVKKFNPNIIIGYPSAIKILAELVQKGDVKLNIRRVVSCGEPLGASLRKYLEDIFQADVINFYGASESLSLGVESDPKEGMLLFDDMNIVEIENGAMYLTCLYNFAQPLIRYRLSDSLTLKRPDKDSRYPFTRAVGLLGRNEDILWFEDENGKREFLHPLAIEGFCIEGLRDYQFRQVSADTFEMQAEIADDASEVFIKSKIFEQMKMILEEKNLRYVRFYMTFVQEILPDSNTGKKRLIIPTKTETEETA